jgi:hypothetical protein
MSAAASIAGNAGRNAQLPEGAQGIEELHTALAPPACRPAAVGGRRVVGDSLRVPGHAHECPEQGWRWRFTLASAPMLDLAGWRAIRAAKGRPVMSCCGSPEP